MMTVKSKTAVFLLALATLCAGVYSRAATFELRGFGKIEESTSQLGDLSVNAFSCQDAEKALLLAHKLGRDMEQSATFPARWEKVKLGEVTANVLIREGIGAFLPAASGSELLVFTSPKTSDLAQVFSSAAGRLQGARFYDPAYRYPAFYDKFSRVGIGSWYPSYWGDAHSIPFTSGGGTVKDKPNTVDDHFAYARKLGLTIQSNGGSDRLRNLLPKLIEYDRPYHFCQWHEWSQDVARMAPEELVVPNDKFTTMPHYYGQISEGGHKLLQYRNWCFQNVVKEHVDNPLLVDWLDPNGEVGPGAFCNYWDFSEANRLNLVRYLKETRGYSLQSLGQAWYGDASRFKSWDDVKIPMDYDFFGFRKGDILANKSWRIHPTSPDKENKEYDSNWVTQSDAVPANVLTDIAKGYPSPSFNDSGWAEFDRPGGELASIYFRADSKHFDKFFWRRGTIDVDAQWLANATKSGRVYLSVIALNSNLGPKKPDRLWINGVEAAAISAPPGTYAIAQVDVTSLIKPGKNNITHLANETFHSSDGPFFLTTRKMESYPFGDSLLNARYYDWHDYVSWCVIDKMEDTYKAIRAVDPDRAIKMHAANDKERSTPLAAKYGCYPHFTGESAFFYPWNKRFAYPYGIPASAEFCSGVVDPKAWYRWFGWFNFEGIDAFDNYHNIQEMMYSPVKELWVQYMPYVKLANRRDLKKPDIALFKSSANDSLLPRQVSASFDIGRGDLQSIGYSEVYTDETSLRNGLCGNYPILWDTDTLLMDPATVANLKKYVEAGGTFVALQETGRHTFTQRDAWPIADLTGFKVREIRPMGGTVSILMNQPIFKKLAGKNFYNRGRSIDYSEYNFADKCVALEETSPDAIPLARYDDGSIAIGMRKLGKGRVIVLGSPFWRDSSDSGGMWLAGESQDAFLEDLLDGLGVKPVATADTHDVWREHYLANNGTEEYLVLFNPTETAHTFSTEWKTVEPAVTLFDPKDGSKIEGALDGNSVKLNNITLNGLETRIIAAQIHRAPSETLENWFNHLALWSRPSAPGTMLTCPDLPRYTIPLAEGMRGKVFPAGTINQVDVAALSRQSDPGSDFVRWVGQSYEALYRSPDPQRRAVLHTPLTLPKEWSPVDKIELILSGLKNTTRPDDAADAYINGVKVLSQARIAADGRWGQLEDGAVADITKALNFNGSNALCVVVGSNGFVGEIKLRRWPAPAEVLDVTGVFNVQRDADSGIGQATVPGVIKGLYAWKDDMVIPASWKGSRVFVNIDVANLAEYDSFAINDKVIFHPVNWYKAVTWMDVTPWVKFGQPNKLTLISRKATEDWLPGSPQYKSITLQRVKAE